MPIQGLLHGLEIGYAHEVADQRQQARQREDQEFQKQLSLLDMIRQMPGFDPEIYKQVLGDTLKLQKGQTTKRQMKGGMEGFLGQTETGPYASDLLKKIQSGEMPIFNDPKAAEKARQPLGPGTVEDIKGHIDAQNGGAGGGQQQGGGFTAGSSIPQPPNPGASMQASQPGSAQPTPPMSPSGAIQPGQQPGQPPQGQDASGGGGAPQGPLPSPPGTGEMLKAGVGVAGQLQATGPLPAPPPPLPSPQAPLTSDQMRPGGSSLFRTGVQQSQHEATAKAAAQPIESASQAAALASQAKAEYALAISMGASPEEAKRAALRKMTGYTGGVQSKQGGMYVAPDGRLVRSILQTTAYGDISEIDPQTQQPLGQDMKPFQPGLDQVVIDKDGVARVVNKASGGVSSPLAGGKAIGKPQIPPPGGPVVTTTGPQGEPQLGRVSRTGTGVSPLTAAGGGEVPPPPAPGQAPTATGGGQGTPLTKFVKPEPYSAAANQVIWSANVVKNISQEAMDTLNQLKAQGYNSSSPIPQEIYKKIYSMGWANANPLEDKLIQYLGVDQVNGMKTYLGGRPNQKMMEIVNMHLPEPGDSLDLAARKLGELQHITSIIENAVDVAESKRRAFPWQQGQGAGAIPPPPSGGAQAKVATLAHVQDYAKQKNIPLEQAKREFTAAGFTIK